MRYLATIRVFEEKSQSWNPLFYKEETAEPLTVKTLKEKCLEIVKLDSEKYEKVSEEVYLNSGRYRDALKDDDSLDKIVHERPVYILTVKPIAKQ